MVDDPLTKPRDAGDVMAADLRRAGFTGAEEIGRGGFGVVYRCAQATLDRVVAVKVLVAHAGDNRARFVREQQAMGRMTGHPNIVSVLQAGETESSYPYIVMPYYRRGSIHAHVRRHGVLSLDEALRLGVKMAGALESAHRIGIVHRDVKPANILLTDYGEPALSDFGIAHISGGFETASGTFTGTPAFHAPEVLGGDAPGPASDVYGLGATLFCLLTGHAAFERRAGEKVVAQFERIAAESVPDLRGHGISHDVSAVIESAMSRDPHDRPSARELGEAIRLVQARHGFTVDEMAVQGTEHAAEPHARSAVREPVRAWRGRLPGALATFVGRRAELSELRALLSTSRLVTLTGTGGVGKTTLATRAAHELSRYFADGVWMIELGDLRDGSLLIEVTAAALGIRDQMGRPQLDVVVDFLSEREALAVFDNCEHVLDAAAELTETLLQACPRLRVLATSREILDIAGESALPLSPLTYPESDAGVTPRTSSCYDAVELFVQRARTAVRGFTLTERNVAAVAQICARLDGLPLAIELAAARLRVMSPDQIAAGLSDRYALLTHGRRGAPPRQQTLAWCMQWSYDLCTEDEKQLWKRLSIFAGSFELEAAHHICGGHLDAEDFLETASALVDKSILIRTESDGAVRFKLLETLRDYGRVNVGESGQYRMLRTRYTDWYHRLVTDAAAKWFGPEQIDLIHRLSREMPNIREALQACLSDSPTIAVEMAAAMRPVWVACGMLNEGRRWLDLALSATAPDPTSRRIKALCDAALIANLQLDVAAARLKVAEARSILDVVDDPSARGLVDSLDGYAGLLNGDIAHARDRLQQALVATDDAEVQSACMVLMGLVLEITGDLDQAMSWYEKALELTEARGESMWRSKILMCVGRGRWWQGRPEAAEQLLLQGLELCHAGNDPLTGAQCLEVLAWHAASENDPQRATTMMAVAAALTRSTGFPLHPLPQMKRLHDECERRARQELGAAEFEAAWDDGSSLTFDEALALALTRA